MTINETELRKLTNGIDVFFIDRTTLPYENLFKHALDGTEVTFTEDQIYARLQAVLSIPGLANVWKAPLNEKLNSLKGDLCRTSAWVHSSSRIGSPSQETVELGKRIFGWWFDTYPKTNLRILFAIVAPDSPHLNNSIYIESGLRIALQHQNPDLDARHEIGHLLFDSYSPHMGEALLYFNEARADSFMACTHLNANRDIPFSKTLSPNGEKAAEVKEWIHKRRMDAFFNLSPSVYWTAAAIEASLKKNKIPEWADNFYTIRGLQIRALDTLLAEKNGRENVKTYSTQEFKNVVNYTGLLNKEALCVSNKYISELREDFLPEKIIEALACVLKTHNLDEATRREGEKVIAAYHYFCPENPVLATPTIPECSNKTSALAVPLC